MVMMRKNQSQRAIEATQRASMATCRSLETTW